MAEESTALPRSQEYHLVFSELISTAQHRGIVTYQEIARIIGLPLSGNYMGARIGGIAGEISKDEHYSKRPMLSAILVNTTGKPGPGFFELARILGRLDSTNRQDESKFWESETQAVYDTWKVISHKSN
jgi:hypothetical protein